MSGRKFDTNSYCVGGRYYSNAVNFRTETFNTDRNYN